MKNTIFTLMFAMISHMSWPQIIPPDFNGEPADHSHAYWTNGGQLLNSVGMLATEVKFYTMNAYPAVYLGDHSLSMVFYKTNNNQTLPDSMQRVDMTLSSESGGMQLANHLQQWDDYRNFYLAHIPNGVTNVKGYKRIWYKDVYPNIDFHVYSNARGLKYYFVVRPGGNPANIRMLYTGADHTLCKQCGRLAIYAQFDSLQFEQARAFQVDMNQQVVPLNWQPWYTDFGNNNIGFTSIGAYNTALPLIIQMDEGLVTQATFLSLGNLKWSTYFGGNNDDYVNAVTLSKTGNLCIAGQTTSHANFPITFGAIQTINTGSIGAFFSYFKPGFALAYSTYFAGILDETSAFDIEVNSKNEIYLYGHTSSDSLPIMYLQGAYNDAVNGALQNPFIAKFNNSGNVLLWCTYFGSEGYFGNFSGQMVIDDYDNYYLTGQMHDGMPLLTPGNAYAQNNGGTADAFIAKFNAQDTLVWFTYIGGAESDQGIAVNMDGNGNIYMCGNTGSVDFPYYQGTASYIDNTLDGNYDMFIAKFNPSMQREWATYFGGNDDEWYDLPTHAIDFDTNNNLYIAGKTKSSDFPLAYPGGTVYIDSSFGGNSDGVLFRFNVSDLSLYWSTYWGGAGWDDLNCIWINGKNRIFAAGWANEGMDTLSFSGFYNQTAVSANSGKDATLAYFNHSLQLEWATYFGGESQPGPFADDFLDITTYNDQLYMVGQTPANSDTGYVPFPLVDYGAPAYFDSTFNGGIYDGFIAMFDISQLTNVKDMPDKNEHTNSLTIYPNPLKESNIYVHIINQTALQGHISLFNSFGQIIKNKSISLRKGDNIFSINTYNLSKGIYYIQFKTKNKVSCLQFIVI